MLILINQKKLPRHPTFKLSKPKTIVSFFHLNNHEADSQLKVYEGDSAEALPFTTNPCYLEVTLVRILKSSLDKHQ